MQAALIGIEDNCRDDKAKEDSPHYGGQRSCGAATESNNVDTGDPVTDAVTQRSDKKDLLHGKNRQRCPRVPAEGKIADDQGDGPVHHDAQDAPTGAGHGTRAGLGQPQPFTRIFGDSGSVRAAQPGANVFTIYHPSSLTAGMRRDGPQAGRLRLRQPSYMPRCSPTGPAWTGHREADYRLHDR